MTTRPARMRRIEWDRRRQGDVVDRRGYPHSSYPSIIRRMNGVIIRAAYLAGLDREKVGLSTHRSVNHYQF